MLSASASPCMGWIPRMNGRRSSRFGPRSTLKSRVSRVRELPAGAGISYGRTFVTAAPTTVALVPVGYGDGYHRILSNRGSVLILGQRAPIRGRVCMDQFVVDVSHIAGVRQDDEVVLIGHQGDGHIRAEEVARLAGTINYEVTTSLLPRVARVYLLNGQIVEIVMPGGDPAIPNASAVRYQRPEFECLGGDPAYLTPFEA